jgi:hypothetical protein
LWDNGHLIVTRLALPAQKCCLQLVLGARLLMRARHRGHRSCGDARVFRPIHPSEKSKNCDKEKCGVAAHSRSAGQELDLICNNNFV